MTNTFYKLLSKVVDRLEKYLNDRKIKQDATATGQNYSPLSPIGNADKDKHYTNALNWALQTRHENDIRNIAITGPYGSGKSSVIKTFQNNYEGSDFQFLNVSLATFKEDGQNEQKNAENITVNSECAENKPVENGGNQIPQLSDKNKTHKKGTNSEELIRLVELSILQQIFYHADDQDIPESRFKKIKRVGKWTLRLRSLTSVLFIISLLFLWRDNLPSKIVSIVNNIDIRYFYGVSVLYTLAICYVVFFYMNTTQRKTYNIKIPIALLTVNLLSLLYIAFTEIKRWDESPISLNGTMIIIGLLEALALAYIIIFSLYTIYSLLKYISQLSINKLKFQDAEIEIDAKINKSILNHHLDEILYFFEATNYNVVVIEDLDRFQQTEIFTKLREINLLLNNSKKTKEKEIVFIYAVRDDMFTDKERSKFFDFIIPIIPVINSTNSNQKLLDKNEQYGYGWSEDLIDSLSIYIDDMRLLHNICNEFDIYRNKLTQQLDPDKLLAILVYKNLFPNDFAKLNNNEGNLWNKINSKQEFISEKVIEIEDEIRSISVEVKKLGKLKIIDIEELRRLYLSYYIHKFENFKCFNINKSAKNIEEMCLDENFNYLIENKATYDCFTSLNAYQGSYKLSTNQSIEYKFADIEVEVDANKTYKERNEEINNWHLGKVNTLREKIQELEQYKVKIRRSKIKDILSTNNIPVSTSKNIKQSKLINVLLRNGYIDEDYHDFMSIFYEGSLTKSDNDFLISVKSQESSEFSFKLSKIDALVKKIHLLDFEQAYILNNDLITFLLNNSKTYEAKIENIFIKLKDESEISIQFVVNYIDNGEELEKFVNKISHTWTGFWKHIENASNLPDDKKDAYFRYILSYADLADIQILSKNSQMESRIEKDESFLRIIPDINRLKEILQTLDLDFYDLDYDNSPDELLTYVYENWNYKIKPSNISGFIKKYGEFDQQTFDTSNYEAIMTSNCSALIDYINSNPDEYVENVHLKIPNNVLEREEYLVKLLNHEELSIKFKNRIVSRTTTIIEVLEKVIDTPLYKILLAENKIASKWSNILHAYSLKTDDSESDEENNLPKEIIDFINVIENSEALSKIKTSTEADLSPGYRKLWRALIHAQGIIDESYNLITKSCPWWYKDLDYSIISEKKVKILINNSCVQPVEDSYEAIKQNHEGLNIYLFERRKNDFLKLLDKLQFDSLDLESILKSTLLTSSEKFNVLNECETEVIQTSNNLKLIAPLLIADESLIVKEEVLDSMLFENNISSEEKLKLFVRNESRYSNEFVEKFIDTLNSKLAKINDKTIKAKIPKSEVNKVFLDILERKGYISSFSETKVGNDYRVNHKRK